MKLGCMNVRGWGIGKFEDVCKELNEWGLDMVGITETHLRETGKVRRRHSLAPQKSKKSESRRT